MKKQIITLALTLLLATSVVAGTLAMYTTSIDNLSEGSVVAKEFILSKGGTDTFTQNVKLAPGESEEWQFSVRNYDGNVISETAMDLDFKIDVTSANGKKTITPLVVSVMSSDGEILGTVAANGTIAFDDEFSLNDVGQEKTYTVSVVWPGNDNADINYAGSEYGTAVKVSVTGVQK